MFSCHPGEPRSLEEAAASNVSLLHRGKSLQSTTLGEPVRVLSHGPGDRRAKALFIGSERLRLAIPAHMEGVRWQEILPASAVGRGGA